MRGFEINQTLKEKYFLKKWLLNESKEFTILNNSDQVIARNSYCYVTRQL